MEIKKRCGNCGRYPFCNKTEGASCYCEQWIKRTNTEIKIIKNSTEIKQ